MASKKKTPEFVVDPGQFGNASDWFLYTPSVYVRAKQVAEDATVDGKDVQAGDYVVVDRDGNVEIVDGAEFEATHEIVKGPHKRAF